MGVVREDRADATLWPLTGPNGTERSLRVHPVYVCNDGEVVRAWALDGFGIVERSEWSVCQDLQTGGLNPGPTRRVLARCRYCGAAAPRAVRAVRVDAFVDRLAAEIVSGGA
ncbi:hypothetical protein SIN08_22190 [Chelativorans sp. M5D2P16]|nr:hypothetical protein [Chelativorans sp. M5D2P16]MDZ5699941.1 hypothetical protein [Chelativorans sp. M5D2P16]